MLTKILDRQCKYCTGNKVTSWRRLCAFSAWPCLAVALQNRQEVNLFPVLVNKCFDHVCFALDNTSKSPCLRGLRLAKVPLESF